MKGQVPDPVRRVSVTDPIAAAGVDATPAWIKRVAGAEDGLGSARILESDANVVVLEDPDPTLT